MFRNYRLKNLNIRLIIACVALTIVGILVIGSANKNYQNKQIIGMVLGLIIMTIFAMIDYQFLLQYYYVFYILTIILLLMVLVLGDNSHGAVRWLQIGGDNGIRFQPSEIGKIFLCMFFAKYLMNHEEDINKPKRILITFILMMIPLALILKEPDLSTTIVTFLVLSFMLIAVGFSGKIIAIILGISVPLITFTLVSLYRGGSSILTGYQDTRIMAWLHPEKYPDDARQQQNSMMAIGSGQFFGKGLYNESATSVKNGNYISEAHTDFIFAVAGEELGFIGSIIIIVLLCIIAYECVKVSKKAKDTSGRLLCIGIASIISIQSFVNICVVTGIMPNTGLPLPFVSYGLTSLVTLYVGIGLVLNIGLQAKKNYLDEGKPLGSRYYGGEI